MSEHRNRATRGMKLSEDAKNAIAEARRKRASKTMDETIEDIRRERAERHARYVKYGFPGTVRRDTPIKRFFSSLIG